MIRPYLSRKRLTPGLAHFLRVTHDDLPARPHLFKGQIDFDRAYRVYDPFQGRGMLSLQKAALILANLGAFV